MKLRIDSVHGHGDQKEERVRLTALGDCNLHYYMVSDATFTKGGKLSNKHRHSKWFDPKEVKKGDRVVLYTRKGKDVTVKGDDGVVWHKVYWGLNSGVWNDEGDAAVLININSWNSTAVK